METYEIYVDCENCNKRNKIVVPQGSLIIEQDCPFCGCKTLKRAS